jgi:hypothetical protein
LRRKGSDLKVKVTMPVDHKFLTHNFGNGFETHNAILNITPDYEPEVLIIGTFNPDTPGNNDSDFYYSRNYFWPAFKNLFVHNATELQQRRDNADPRNPSTEEIFQICRRLKLTFADLIKQVGHNGNAVIEMHGNIVNLHDEAFNLIDDIDLLALHALGQINWGTDDILAYIQVHPTIHSIYFSRKPVGVWGHQWLRIVNHPSTERKHKVNIYTPAGRRIPNPVMSGLLNRWLFNENPNFGRLKHQWLLEHNVNLQAFE